jgi:hypothetical protein
MKAVLVHFKDDTGRTKNIAVVYMNQTNIQ